MPDAWGGSWGFAWGGSWGGETAIAPPQRRTHVPVDDRSADVPRESRTVYVPQREDEPQS